MSFNLGLKCIRKLVEEQDALAWHKAKLNPAMFKGEQEVAAFHFVNTHISKYHDLPKPETLFAAIPEAKEVVCPEPSKYYLDQVDHRYFYNIINTANLESQEVLKENKDASDKAVSVLETAIKTIKQQQYRHRIMDVGEEAPQMVITSYHSALSTEGAIKFFWPYMDDMCGGAVAGDVVSFIGRPASGKTFKVLRTALKNWHNGKNVLVVSMEMNSLAIAQRLAAMYANTPLTQLKLGGYATQTYKKFVEGLMGMHNEKSKFYVVDGQLAAHVEEIYILAAQLKVDAVFIDGAYLLRHPNTRLDRYTKVAENCEMIKARTEEIEIPTFASWQFNREASKKQKSGGGKGGLEDIAFSDAIGQISSIVLALFQEDGVETMYHRVIDVLKGRNGEVGQFKISWDFIRMIFDQLIEQDEIPEDSQLEFI